MDLTNSRLIYDFLRSDASAKGAFQASLSNIQVVRQEGQIKIKYDWIDYRRRFGSEEITVSEFDLIVFTYESLGERLDVIEPGDEGSKHY